LYSFPARNGLEFYAFFNYRFGDLYVKMFFDPNPDLAQALA